MGSEAAQTPPSSSPLAEANPRSLEELMSLDPLKMLRKDRNKIVEEFRRMRAVWEKTEAEGRTVKASAKAPAASSEPVDLGF